MLIGYACVSFSNKNNKNINACRMMPKKNSLHKEIHHPNHLLNLHKTEERQVGTYILFFSREISEIL